MKNMKLAAALMAASILTINLAFARDATSNKNSAEQVAKATQKNTKSTISVEVVSPEIRKVKFANPPLNLIVPETLASLNETIKTLNKDENVKVVIFTSEVAGFFYNHFDTNEFPNFLSQVGANAKPLWVELMTNLSRAPFISIASINGRTQGGGDELALAFDLRYASKEKAIFGQPEVGIGLFPGGGGTYHLTRLAGRDRALEVLLSSDDYSAETAEKFGWVTRAMPEAQLDGFVNKMAARLATFDKTALVTTKRQVNAGAFPTEAELQSSYSEFTKSLAWPGLQPRMQLFGKVIQEMGPLKVENNMGYFIGEGNKQLQQQQAGKK